MTHGRTLSTGHAPEVLSTDTCHKPVDILTTDDLSTCPTLQEEVCLQEFMSSCLSNDAVIFIGQVNKHSGV